MEREVLEDEVKDRDAFNPVIEEIVEGIKNYLENMVETGMFEAILKGRV